MKRDPLSEHFGSAEAIPGALAAACAGTPASGAALAILDEEDIWLGAHGRDERGGIFEPTTLLQLGCAVRLFTGALIAALVREHRVALDDDIVRHVNFQSAAADDYLRGTTVRHLLSQSDGIGFRPLLSLPTTPDGRIDAAALGALICSDRRDAPPGHYFSGNAAGFGLLGALIERHVGLPYTTVVRQELLKYLPAHRHDASSAGTAEALGICAATGKGLALSAASLGEFLQLQLNPHAFPVPIFAHVEDFSVLFEKHVDYPGWSAGMTGSCLAWKSFSGGWVGQNGAGSEGETLVVRLHPRRRVAVAFLCPATLPVAYGILARLLGPIMSEFNPPDAPRLLSPQERGALDGESFVGTFGNRSRRIEVSQEAEGALSVRVSQTYRGEHTVLGTGTLVPATKDIFFIPPPNAYGTWFIQYVPHSSGRPERIWDGWYVWPRAPGST